MSGALDGPLTQIGAKSVHPRSSESLWAIPSHHQAFSHNVTFSIVYSGTMIVVELWTTLKRSPRIGLTVTALAAGKGATMDHDQKMKAPLLAELLALCQQIATLGPDHLTPYGGKSRLTLLC